MEWLVVFSFNIYLFIDLFILFWLPQVLVAARGIFAAECGLLVAACVRDLVP